MNPQEQAHFDRLYGFQLTQATQQDALAAVNQLVGQLKLGGAS